MDNNDWIRLGVSFGTLGIIIATSYYYEKPLFDYSLTFIKEVQQFDNIYFKWFMMILTFIGGGSLNAVAISIIVVWYKLDRTFLFMLCNSLIIWFIENAKVVYHYPRPFWVDSGIQAFICASGYGFPSGHSTS